MKFGIIILNSKGVVVDKIVVNSDNYALALLDAEKVFLSKYPEFEFSDSGMFIGSNERDLTVENKNSLEEEYYKLKIVE